jgi:hypothetical protein
MAEEPGEAQEKAETASWRPALIIVLALSLSVAVFFHLFHLNSHYFHTWYWQRAPVRPLAAMFAVAAVPFFAGQWVFWRWRRTAPALVLIMASMLGMMLAGAAAQRDPPSLHRIVDVEVNWDTGYFQAAQILHDKPIRQWLADYPQLQERLTLHPRTKPPGLVLFETILIDLLGETRAAAMTAGLIVAVLGACSVAATFAFVRYFTGSTAAAFCAASYFALCPGPVLIFPDFDQCYPILTFAITVLWAEALRKNRAAYSAALGVLYGAVMFFTYLPIVLVVFLLGYAAMKSTWRRFARHAAVSVICFAGFNLALWFITGFNAVATFRECLRQVDVLWDILSKAGAPARHLPWTIPADLYDFALGSGWVSFVLAVFYFWSWRRERDLARWRICLLAIGQIFFVAFSGLIQGETARLWIFLLPMLLMPVGLELSRWRARDVVGLYAAMLILTVSVSHSMEFFLSAQVFRMEH